MKLSAEIKKSIDKSVLCWLATVSVDGMPNVSPKEVFTYFGEDAVLVANIASPQTVKNIKANNKVCISFIDILVQKGFQLKGEAEIIYQKDLNFSELEEKLLPIINGVFPIASIIKIEVHEAKPIIAPRYMFFPETTEEQQIANARKTYGF